MPLPIVAGNWKMNTGTQEAQALAKGVRRGVEGVIGVEVVLCPPFPHLALVHGLLAGSAVLLGAQNMHQEAAGAFTGEVSAAILAELCRFVILGHSERRRLFGETDQTVNLKVKAALAAGLRPIVCVGETMEERGAGQAQTVVARQVRAGLDGVEALDGMAVAYEPVWAIGTGDAATPETAEEVMGGAILPALAALFGEREALNIPLLYGGSVTAANVEGFLAQSSLHGALVGGASLRAEEFSEIARITARIRGGERA